MVKDWKVESGWRIRSACLRVVVLWNGSVKLMSSSSSSLGVIRRLGRGVEGEMGVGRGGTVSPVRNDEGGGGVMSRSDFV